MNELNQYWQNENAMLLLLTLPQPNTRRIHYWGMLTLVSHIAHAHDRCGCCTCGASWTCIWPGWYLGCHLVSMLQPSRHGWRYCASIAQQAHSLSAWRWPSPSSSHLLKRQYETIYLHVKIMLQLALVQHDTIDVYKHIIIQSTIERTWVEIALHTFRIPECCC